MGKYLGGRRGEATVMWMGGGTDLYGRTARNTTGGWICSLGGEKHGFGPESTAAGGSERWREEEGKWGRRGLKLPSRQRLPRDERQDWFGGQTCFSAGLACANVDAGKNICEPRANAACACSPVFAKNCILVVIMPFWRICGIC
jgi:hypothetical protein